MCRCRSGARREKPAIADGEALRAGPVALPSLMGGADPDTSQAWWLYLLACRDGRTYAGIACDVEARFGRHAAGKGSKFTRSNPPLRILGAQPFATKSQALQAEHALKRLRPAAKMDWAAQWPWRAACPPDTREIRDGLVNGRSTADNPGTAMPGVSA